MQSRSFRLAVLVLFLFSGASGLIYQIVWTKQLTHIMGVTVYAVSTVLASFMAGLALGSWLFGRRVDRSRSPLRLYALLEGGIGIYALLIPLLFALITETYVAAHGSFSSDRGLLLLLRFVLCFITILIPTTLMGGTLPVLSKFFVEREKHIGLGIGTLYAINTAGAVAGTFFAGFFLIPFLGVSNTTTIAIIINLAVAGLALVVAFTAKTPAASRTTETETTDDVLPYPAYMTRVVFWVIGLSGLAAIGYEVLWTRILVYSLGPSTYAFSAMLTTFLVGIAVGSVVISRFIDRLRDPVKVFGAIEILLGLSALVAVLLIDRMFDIMGFLKENVQGASWWLYMSTLFLLAFIFMFLPTFFMGAAFPLAARIYSRGLDTLGKKVGNIYSINTLFGIAGSLITGFLLVPSLGIQRSMVILIVLNLLLGAVLFLANPLQKTGAKALLTGLAVLCLAGAVWQFEDKPVVLSFDRLLHRAKSQDFDLLYCREGIDASLAVLEGQVDKVRELNINGTNTAYSSEEDLKVHRLLAHIPMATHPDPRTVLVIGFGMGVTAYGTSLYDVERIDCVELVEDEQETAKYFEDYNHGIIDHERFNFIPEDGRNFVLTTKNTYDVISMNAIHPSLAPSLYTHDLYRLCREKLSPGGLMCVWLPTTMLSREELHMLFRTFQEVFPDTTLWYNNPAHVILLGSADPYSIDFARFLEAIERPAVKADLETSNMSDPYAFLSMIMMTPDELRELTQDALINTDDRPYIEFSRSMYAGFKNEILEDLFFTTKADVPSLLQAYGITEEARREVERRFASYNRAWPFMVEGELIKWHLPGEVQRRNANWCFLRALDFTPADRHLVFQVADIRLLDSAHHWRIKNLEKEGSGSARELLTLAGLHLEAGNFTKAYDLLTSLEKRAAVRSAELLAQLASACVGTGRVDEAMRLLEEAVELHPDAERPKTDLAWLLLAQGDPASRTRALALATAAVKMNPSETNLDLLGVAYFDTGDLERAENMLLKAISKAYDIHFTFRFHLACVRAAK
jgi:spermidine synthase